MGIFGVGNTGAAVTKLVAPTIVVAYGWTMVPQVYAVMMTAVAVLFWFFTYDDPDHKVGNGVAIKEQLAALKDPRVWRYSQYYSIVFGGYVALSLWMTKYYISEYGFDLQAGGAAGGGFSIPGGRAARHRRLVLGQVRRAHRHLVGAVGRPWCACSSCPIRRPISPFTP